MTLREQIEEKLCLLTDPTNSWNTKDVEKYFKVSNIQACRIVKKISNIEDSIAPIYSDSKYTPVKIDSILSLFGTSREKEIENLTKVLGGL